MNICSNEQLTIDKNLVFFLIEKKFNFLSVFFNKVSDNYKKLTNNFLFSILKKEINNLELKNFLKVLFWIFGIAILIYLCSFVNQINKEISNYKFLYFNNIQLKKDSAKTDLSFRFHYWTSTLFLLVKSNKYNLFII